MQLLVGSPPWMQGVQVLEPSHAPRLAPSRRQGQRDWHCGDTLEDAGAQPVTAAPHKAKLNYSG